MEMWLLMLLVVECNSFLLEAEAEILQGYSLVTRWVFVHCSSMQLFMKYLIKVDTDLDTNAGILYEAWYFLQNLWDICQMFIDVFSSIQNHG